jgi:hypothetical protein
MKSTTVAYFLCGSAEDHSSMLEQHVVYVDEEANRLDGWHVEGSEVQLLERSDLIKEFEQLGTEPQSNERKNEVIKIKCCNLTSKENKAKKQSKPNSAYCANYTVDAETLSTTY